MRTYARLLTMLLLCDVNKPVARMLISIMLCDNVNMQICILRKHTSRSVVGLSQLKQIPYHIINAFIVRLLLGRT